MIEFNAKDLTVGDEFTTQEDQGEVWFRVAEVKPHPSGMLDVLGVVVSHNPDVDYAVGDSEWMDLEADEKVIVR
jgi:hypothetical protein